MAIGHRDPKRVGSKRSQLGPRKARKTRTITGPHAPFRAFGVLRGSPISSHRVSAVSFRLHLSAPSAISVVNPGRFGMAFGGPIARMVRGERPRLHRTHFTTVFPTSACSVGHLDPFRALGVFHGSQISSHRVSAVSFRLHLSVPAATSAVNSGEIRNNLQRSRRRHGPRRAAAATPAHPHPCRSVSIRGCPLAELFGNADRRG